MDKEILKKNIEANGEYIELQVLEEECEDVSIAMAQAMEILEVEDAQYMQKIKEKMNRLLERLEWSYGISINGYSNMHNNNKNVIPINQTRLCWCRDRTL